MLVHMDRVGHTLNQPHGGSMRLYLDNCCLNRPFDDQGQEKIRLESEAVVMVLASIQSGRNLLVGSTMLDLENSRNPDSDRQNRVRRILDLARTYVEVGEKENQRAAAIAAMGFRADDAMHIACAESGRSACLMTTDDRLVKRSFRIRGQLRVVVCNPLDWIQENRHEP